MTTINVNTIDDLATAAKSLLEICKNKKVFAFYGEMGAGKTTFVKSLCTELGCEDTANSPTYSLVNQYHYTKNDKQNTIFHIDLYRLNDFEEALAIGIEEYLYADDAYCFIEWPQIITPLLTEDVVKVYIEEIYLDSVNNAFQDKENSRLITIEKN